MKTDGKNFQRLVRAIEGALAAGNKSVKIEVSKKLPDKVTGRPREHDVVLTVTTRHHQTVIALECRDRSRPIDVNAVEAFKKKCEDTGVHYGIIVSAKGFYRTAIKKAEHHSIGCMTLDEAECFSWCLAPGMAAYQRIITHTDFELTFLTGPDISKDSLQNEHGQLVTSELINGWAVNVLNHYHPSPLEGPGDYRVVACEENPKIFAIQDGQRVQARHAAMTLTYKVVGSFVPFSFCTYLNAGKSQTITQAAIATVPVGGDRTADFVLSTMDDGRVSFAVVGGGLTLTPAKPQSRSP